LVADVIAPNDAVADSYREVEAAAGESGAAQDLGKGALGVAGLAGLISNPFVLGGAAIAGAAALAASTAAPFYDRGLVLKNN
jgi:hypothetical protein